MAISLLRMLTRLPRLPCLAQIRNLPMSRQAVHAVAPSGNGLVVAVVRSAGTRGSEAVKTSMVFQRVCQATVHLLTLYGGSGGSEGGTAGVQPLTPPPPGLVGAGLLFQPPTASALWDSHAALVLRPGLSAAARLPLKGLSDAAWTTWGELGGGEGASQADDDAMLEQVQPAVSTCLRQKRGRVECSCCRGSWDCERGGYVKHVCALLALLTSPPHYPR